MTNFFYWDKPKKLVEHSLLLYKYFIDSLSYQQATRVKNFYPEVLFENSFHRGVTLDLLEALRLDPTLKPKEERKVILLAQEEKKGILPFNPSYGRQKLAIRPLEVILTNYGELHEWQKWRMEGIVSRKYTRFEFSKYNSMWISELDYMSARAFVNESKPIQMGGYHFTVPRADWGRHKVNYSVLWQNEQPSSELFRYEMEIVFEPNINEEVKQDIINAYKEKSTSSLNQSN